MTGLHYQGLSQLAYALSRWLNGERLDRYTSAPLAGPAPRSSVTLIVTPERRSSEELVRDLDFFLGPGAVEHFSSWELLPYEALSPTTETVGSRLKSLAKLLQASRKVVVASIDSLFQRCIRPELLQAAQLSLSSASLLDRDELLVTLDVLGYRRSTLTEEVGQFSVRGAIIDIFPAGAVNPVRLEFFGDRLESIREFQADSQRSFHEINQTTILPCQEHLAPWRVSACPLLRGYELGESESQDHALNRLRELAEAVNLPRRELDLFEDVLLTGADFPGIEQLLPIIQPNLASLFEYLPADYDVVLIEKGKFEEATAQFSELCIARREESLAEGRLTAEGLFFSAEELQQKLADRIRFDCSGFREPGYLELEVSSNSEMLLALRRSHQAEFPFQPLAQEIELRRAQGYEVSIAVSQSKKLPRFVELLESYKIPSYEERRSFGEWQSARAERQREYRITTKAPVALLRAALGSGVRVERDGVLVIADHEIFPDISLRKPAKSARQARRVLGNTSQLREDDYVVHIDHGVALYRGLKQIELDGKVSDFLQLEYAEGAKLFVPVENIGKVQKYLGADGRKPQLTKLGGRSWSQAKEKVRKNVQELAGELVSLYAKRQVAQGISYGPFDADDRQFADTFPYQETPDQEQAISDVISDMERERPMDRLVCGDVGYGKTEVALRAAFKAVNAGRQVAVLVPTTILADQHFMTFRDRMAEFGFKVSCVSRFYGSQENRKTIQEASEGKIDVLVGTHRLLQKDVFFKNLGLLIIDEEHRFGVADKERIKRFRSEVDVLTLTATPIPRTLHMSLLSIRDLSIIETPPTNRQLIQTYVGNYQDSIVREAILRELGRSGQIFYINNRVQNIQQVCEELRALIPEARIEFAHGQMREEQLESVMHRFIKHEFDVLVSTTIVESGLDIPNANTIIIRDADKLGLAELYQLRGRVGRSSRRAFAYLLVRNAKGLSADAQKRLDVLRTLDDLGMGFRLALQDMEIRGAGNLLGKDQSGKIELVGFDLYSRILKEAVRELRKDKVSLDIDPELSVGFPAHIPLNYIPDVEERILLYQRLNEVLSEELPDLVEEIEDRFGRPPQEVKLLLLLMELKCVLRTGGIVSATRRGRSFSLAFHPEAPVDQEKLAALIARSRGKIRLTGPYTVVISLDDEPKTPEILTKKAEALLALVATKSEIEQNQRSADD
jgi:transcription-repair coupling factor (superfamily II helicase)